MELICRSAKNTTYTKSKFFLSAVTSSAPTSASLPSAASCILVLFLLGRFQSTALRGLCGVVGLTLPMARADRGSRPVYYLPSSDLGQVVNLSLSVA